MRFLGIDYGAKRIGIALSDEGGKLAFPREILPNDSKVFEKLEGIIRDEGVAEIVIGETDLILRETEIFREQLAQRFGIAVRRQKEELTTREARRYQGGVADARAAALILQRYLDRKT
ncbi:MAG: RuvX/YqgF family protein [Patescibacteria group bacterium]